ATSSSALGVACPTATSPLSLHDALPISSARDLCDRAAPRQQRHAELQFDRALDAVEARERDHHPQRHVVLLEQPQDALARGRRIDRKSTRLNSSHRTISYAVFCLKKKTP